MKIRSPKHLEYVRSYPCIINDGKGNQCNGSPVVAHHLTHVKDKGGMGLKTGDEYTLPLCWLHHQTLHNMGEKSFWEQWDVDEMLVVNNLARVSPCNKIRSLYVD